ncbi:hypothetical protein ACFXTH_019171 [Malus domestica]
MGSKGNHSTQNDTPLALGARQRKKEGKRVALQAKVDELEIQNNKIIMKNEVFHEQYEKLFETLHETRRTQTRELVTPVDINHHLGAPQHGGSPSFDMGIPDEERANHQNIDQHKTSLNLAASNQRRRNGGRHILTEGVEGSKAVFRDCRDFLKQRRDNPIHVNSKINDPRVFERLGPLLCPKPATNLRKGQQVLEKRKGIGDSEMFRQTYLGSQYDESKEKSHALDQTFILPRQDGDLRKKALVVHDSTQDPLVLQLFNEVNKLKAERQAEILDWNQPRPGPLTRRILDTPSKQRQSRSLACNSILERMTQLNILTFFSLP